MDRRLRVIDVEVAGVYERGRSEVNCGVGFKCAVLNIGKFL
jgi:hypothetical protein